MFLIYRDELSSLEFPDDWFKGIMEFSAEEANEGNLMIIWIGGRAAQVADTLPDEQVCPPPLIDSHLPELL